MPLRIEYILHDCRATVLTNQETACLKSFSLRPQDHARSAGQDPPEVVMNDMGPSGQQHLSLSRTTALRAHQIEPFVQGLKETIKSSRR